MTERVGRGDFGNVHPVVQTRIGSPEVRGNRRIIALGRQPRGSRRTDGSLLMAGNVIATLPLIVLFLVARKQFLATMTFSGVKG